MDGIYEKYLHSLVTTLYSSCIRDERVHHYLLNQLNSYPYSELILELAGPKLELDGPNPT